MKIQLKGYTIIIHIEALSVADHYTQLERKQPEAGGVIMGKLIQDEVHILKLSPPTELDTCSRTNFVRNRLSAQIIINYEFYNSNKQITYLGEWHTHPEDSPSPSGTDMKMIYQQFNENVFHTDFVILLIKGLKELYIGILDKKGYDSMNIALSN